MSDRPGPVRYVNYTLDFTALINKLYQIQMVKRPGRKEYKALAASRLYQACCRGLTFTWFAFTLYWFWAGWTEIGTILGTIGRPPSRRRCSPPSRWQRHS